MDGIRNLVLCAVAMCAFTSALPAQEKDAKSGDKPDAAAAPAEKPKEESFVTDHTLKLAAQTIPYKATAGTIMLKNEKDEPTALVYYTAYSRTDAKDASQRPLSFVYNGGPGSASMWLHMGAFGPRRVASVDVGAGTAPPFKLVDNNETLLDKTDLVFVDPVGTGFSHAAGKAQDKDFWGVDQDVKSLAQFVQTYINRNNRWNSPKFLIGESYGTFRSAALANYLQSKNGIYLNGIVLISNVLDLGSISFLTGVDTPYILYLPSYAATAWTHNLIPDRPASLEPFLQEARHFASTEYADALMKGRNLPAAQKADTARKLSRFTGLSEDYLLKADLRVSLPQFMQELQRSRGLITGRLDSRFTGPAFDLLSEFGEYDPQSSYITGPFVATFNSYVREELKFGQDKSYHLFAPIDGQWDWKHAGADNQQGFPGAPNVEADLVAALLSNPHLQVEVENGFFDLATPFFGSEYTMDHLGLPAKLQSNIHHKYYNAGHMMYVRDEDRVQLKNNVASFIDSSIAK